MSEAIRRSAVDHAKAELGYEVAFSDESQVYYRRPDGSDLRPIVFTEGLILWSRLLRSIEGIDPEAFKKALAGVP